MQGRVRIVEPGAFTKVSALGVEEQRVWVVIDLMSPHEQWAALGDGFRVDASIAVAELDDALLVPVGALLRRDKGWSVFVVQNGRALERPIEIAGRAARLPRSPRASRPAIRSSTFLRARSARAQPSGRTSAVDHRPL